VIVNPIDRPTRLGETDEAKVFVKRGRGEGQVYVLYDFVFVRDGICMCKNEKRGGVEMNGVKNTKRRVCA
jgi:hypothetical protein